MDADRPPPEAISDDPDADELSVVPAVVAVVVARGDATHLEGCLTSLAGSDYPDLTVLVMAAPGADLTARVAAVLPNAFVRTVEAGGFAAAANDARTTVAGAPFLLFCHDDVVVDPNAIRILVEEAYRSNAAIVGPKVVDVDRPEILREVGWSVDRFGIPHSSIVTDELDQEQHDAVRDVFFVGDACVLVRADLFTALEGFDTECDPGARALDLCWRARLAGARVIVAPDARIRHHDADEPVDPRLAHRHQVRALLTSTSALRLLWIAPLAFVMQASEALVFLVRRRRDRARGLVGAWTYQLRDLSSLRAARRRAQLDRVVGDGELHAFQFKGSARVSAYVATTLHAPDRVRALSDRGRSVADTAGTQLRSLRGLVLVGMLALVLFGVRDLVFGRVSAVGTMLPWPDVGDLARGYTSEWRYASLGSHAPAPPVFVFAALLRILTLGADGFGRTLLVVGAIPFAMFGAYRLGRTLVGRGWPSLVVAVAYGALPLPRNAIEQGRIGSLVVYALAPLIALAVLALGGLVEGRWPRRRIAALGGLGVAVSAAWLPLAILFPFVIGIGLLVAAPASGDRRTELGAVARAVLLTTGLGLALLLPWPIAFALSGDRIGALGIVLAPVDSFAALLRFATASSGSGIGGWAFVAIGLLALLVSDGERFRWCARWWGIALVSWLLAVFPTWLDSPSPETEALLVPAGLAVAVLAGVLVATFLGDIRQLGIGWRQVGAVVAGGFLVLAMLGFVGDTVDGRFRQPGADHNETLAWMNLQQGDGPFRVLWVGAPDVVPGYLNRVGGDAYAVTNAGPGDLRDALTPPGGAGGAAVAGAVRRLQDRTTQRLGRMVAPMAVRYVVLPERVDPGASPGSPSLAAALGEQLDLRELQGTPGTRVYENTAWIPGDAIVSRPVPASTSISPPVLGRVTGRAGDVEGASGTLIWSQGYDRAWSARDPEATLEHEPAVGWTNAFTSNGRGPIGVSFVRQWWRWPLLAIEVLITVALARRVLRRGRRRRGRPSVGASEQPGAADPTNAAVSAVGSPPDAGARP